MAFPLDYRILGPLNPQGRMIFFRGNPNLKMLSPSYTSRCTQLRLLDYIYEKVNKQIKTIGYDLIAVLLSSTFPKKHDFNRSEYDQQIQQK